MSKPAITRSTAPAIPLAAAALRLATGRAGISGARSQSRRAGVVAAFCDIPDPCPAFDLAAVVGVILVLFNDLHTGRIS